MSHQDILTLAKQGDPRAIGYLIDQALRPKGIAVKVTRQQNGLHILLEANSLPVQDACIRVIQKGLLRLESASLGSVTLYGRQVGQQLPGWTQTIDLKQPVGLNSTLTPPSPAPNLEARGVNSSLSPHPGQPQKPWLLVGSVSLVLLPLSGFVLNSQLQKTLTPLSKAEKPPALTKSSLPSPSPATKAKETPATKKPTLSSPSPAASKTQTTKKITLPSDASRPPQKAPLSPATTITIKAVGDIIPGSNYPVNKLPKEKELLFESVKPYLQGADILFGNFESTLTDYVYSSKSVGGGQVFAFRTPPSYNKLLKQVGFDILNVANNHSYDFNEQGFKDTIKNIDSAGMIAVGKKNQIVYKEVKGVTVAFIGFSNYGDVHNSLLDFKESQAIVKKAREKANIVVISVHAGAEGTGALRVKNQNEFFLGENRGNMLLFSHTMIDAGADLILGHGPHVTRAVELYKGKLIAYSLGNFMGYRTLSTAAELGNSMILEVKLNPEGQFVAGKIIPVQLDGRGIPKIDNDFSTVGLIRKLTKTDFPDTPLKIDQEGRILKN